MAEPPSKAREASDVPWRTFDQQVEDARRWLREQAAPSRTPLWSYSAKHWVQRWCGNYISSAAVVAAARAAGVRVGTVTPKGNAWVYVAPPSRA